MPCSWIDGWGVEGKRFIFVPVVLLCNSFGEGCEVRWHFGGVEIPEYRLGQNGLSRVSFV